MAKITQVTDGESGLSARTKINNAIASVEKDATLTGDGNVGTPLSVVTDATITDGSTNPVQSNAVFDGLALKADKTGYFALTGFVSWGGSGNYYSLGGNVGGFYTLTLLRSATGKIDGVDVTAAASQTVQIPEWGTSYVGVDSAGILVTTTTVNEAWYASHFALFEVIADDTQTLCVFENHPIGTLQGEAGNFAHHVLRSVIGLYTGEYNEIGGNLTRVATGTGGAVGDRQLKIVGNAMLYDHGIESPILDTSGSPITSYFAYTDGSGRWKSYAHQTEFPMVYNNAGTITALGAGNYSIQSVYVTKQDPNNGTTYITIIGTSSYSNLGQAQTALANGNVPKATNAIAKLEVALLGYVIVHNSGGGYINTVQISKQVAGAGGLGGGVGGSAALTTTDVTNFNGVLSSSDVTTQLALETIDDSDLARVNAQTGTTYTLVLSDRGKYVTLDNASAITLTVPLNSSVAFPIGTIIQFQQKGAGEVTVSPTGGVTITSGSGALKTLRQYSEASLRKVATDTWTLIGEITT